MSLTKVVEILHIRRGIFFVLTKSQKWGFYSQKTILNPFGTRLQYIDIWVFQLESQHVEFWRTEFWHVEFWHMMRRKSQTGLEWRISPPICARIPRKKIPCAETLEMPLELKKVIYFQHVELSHVEFWRIYEPEFHVREIHVLRFSTPGWEGGGLNLSFVPKFHRY